MGKIQKKTGKGRLDKYYRLAKEQGYRARSAFKLIQLDKKYDFLSSARCCIDLCAAPGGWLQVATKYMPPNSIILGVDLVPIRPIPRVITFAEDITSDKCRKRIREEIKDWKADVVLHDGAPNVGTAWAQDAFTQSELVLSSLKLATEFLTNGGTFVTKVFRSKDYNSLLWVFNQLFQRVEATKPPSSRNVSAEIFVVCTGYRAPKKIDPRLLNPTHVFQDLDVLTTAVGPDDDPDNPNANAGQTRMDKLTPAAFNVFHPDKKRRQREGYAEGDLTLFKQLGVMDFIKAADPISILGTANELQFSTPEEKSLLSNEATTGDITTSCSDLKVLGKKDFKTLLRWRTTMREQLGLDVKKSKASEGELVERAEIKPLTEDEEMALEIERLEAEDTHRRRRDRRRANEKKNREVQRMQLHMTTPMDIGIERQDGLAPDGDQDMMFDLGEAEGKYSGKRVNLRGNEADESEDDDSLTLDGGSEGAEDDEDADEDDDRFNDLEENLDQLYDDYQNTKLERDAKHRAREARQKRDAQEGGEWKGFKHAKSGDAGAASGSEGEDEDEDDGDEADTMAYLDQSHDAIPADELDTSDEEELEDRQPSTSSTQRSQKPSKLLKEIKKPELNESAKSRAAAMWFDQSVFKGIEGMDDVMKADVTAATDSRSSQAPGGKVSFDETSEGEPSLAPKKRKGKHVQSNPELWDEEEDQVISEEQENAQRIADYGLTTAEAMTLAQQLVNREKTTEQLVSDGFNRHAFNDKDGLPTWFLDDEMKHFRNNIPVTKEAVDAIREKMRALNARPIKKIAEAKARKKMRTLKRLSKAAQKAEAINDTEDITEREKASQISRLVSRATKDPKKTKKEEIKVVVARGANRGLKGRPGGVKGRFRMVDPRGKKELRAQKRIARAAKTKRR